MFLIHSKIKNLRDGFARCVGRAFMQVYMHVYIYFTWNPFVLGFASKRRSFPIKTISKQGSFGFQICNMRWNGNLL